MNENKLICKGLRKEFGKIGWTLLLYYTVMNLSVMLVMIALWVVVYAIILSTPNITPVEIQWLYQLFDDNISWGYALSIAVCGALLLWKHPKLCRKTMWQTSKPMRWGRFFVILPIFISGQALYQVLTPLLEWLFRLLGVSLEDSIASATGSSDSLSMFLYVCLLAPVWEEILFRGYVMRTLEHYGKKFAIIASAFLFGVYHGNVVQIPYAFAVGLVLGYVAMEHSMVWAMVLHMINNLLLGDTLGRLLQNLPVVAQEIIFLVLIWGCALAAVIILVCKRKNAAAYLRSNRIHPLCLKSFFTSPGILVLTGVLLVATTLFLFI